MVSPIDTLADAELAKINRQHAWVTGTADARGRVLGHPSRLYKIPERRVQIGQEKLGYAGKSVVEFGSLEGAHTVALCRLAKSVIALEAQPANIEKTKVRSALYGVSPDVRKIDLETTLPPPADLYFHSGVLYHLQDPVGHLLKIIPLCKEILLDTHYAKAPKEIYQCPVNKETYSYWVAGEMVGDSRSGLRPFSRWISLEAIVKTLSTRFKKVEVVRNEIEKNGPRVTIVASVVK